MEPPTAETSEKFEGYSPQQLVDITYSKARAMQSMLDAVTEPDLPESLYADSLTELNALNPYKNQGVYISGNGKQLIMDSETNNSAGSQWGYIPECLGFHHGFKVIEVESEDEPKQYKIMHQILVGGDRVYFDDNVRQQLEFYNYFDLDSSCLEVSEIDDIYYGNGECLIAEVPQRLELLQDYAVELGTLVSSRTFRRMHHTKQRKIVNTTMGDVQDLANVRGVGFLAEVEYGFLPDHYEGRSHFLRVELGAYAIGGIILGVASIDHITLQEHAIRKQVEATSNNGGLCLLIAPNQSTREGLYMRSDQILFLPIHQAIEIEVDEDTE